MSKKDQGKSNTMNQNGEAGGSLIQVGRDYIRYISVNIANGNLLAAGISLIPVLAVIYVLGTGAKWTWNQIENNVQNPTASTKNLNSVSSTPELSASPSVSSAPEPLVNPSVSSNPFDNASFPKDSCGDSLPDNPEAYPVAIYPVFVEYSETNLQVVTSKFCKDAYKTTRKTTGKLFIQVASLVELERANAFRDFMIKKIGSGEIGEPRIVEAKITPSPVASSTPSPTPSSTSSLLNSQPLSSASEYQVEIDCTKTPAGKTGDLEFIGCKRRDPFFVEYQTEMKTKNYTSSFFEVQDPLGDISLIYPGKEEKVMITLPKKPKVDEYRKYKIKRNLKVFQYSSSPVLREVTISCDKKPPVIWELEMSPRCTSDGIYIDIAHKGDIFISRPPIVISLPGGKTTSYKPGNEGWITFNDRTVTVTLQAQ